MSGRRRARHRLLWAGALLVVVLLIAAISVLRAGLWVRDEAVRLASRRDTRGTANRLQPKGRHA